MIRFYFRLFVWAIILSGGFYGGWNVRGLYEDTGIGIVLEQVR